MTLQNFTSSKLDYSQMKRVSKIINIKGIIKKNKFINFEIEIVEKNSSVCHEIKYIGILNHHHKKFEVRIGTPIIIYFTDIYL